jgi:hypothetical protein
MWENIDLFPLNFRSNKQYQYQVNKMHRYAEKLTLQVILFYCNDNKLLTIHNCKGGRCFVFFQVHACTQHFA